MALDVGHGDEDLSTDLVDFVHRANVRVIDRRGGLGFAAEALFRFGVFGEVRGEKLQRDGAVEFGIEGLVDDAHAAFADLFEQAVVGDGALGCRARRKPDDLARFIDSLDDPDKSIPSPRQGLDEARLVGGITQRLPQFADGNIEALFEINEGFVGPQPFVKRLARDEFGGAFEQRRENLKRLLLQADPNPALAEFAGFEVQFEGCKTHHLRNLDRILHRNARNLPTFRSRCTTCGWN